MTSNKAYVVIGSVSAPATTKIGALYDQFSGTELNTAIWTAGPPDSAVSVSESGSVLSLSIAESFGNYWGGVFSNDTYDLIDSSIYVQMGVPGSSSYRTGIYLLPAVLAGDISSPNVSMFVENGQISGGLGQASYDAETMNWVRIRESWGTLYFDTAPDGVTWTNQFTCLDEQTGLDSLTALYVYLEVEEEATGGGTATFANLNSLAGPPSVTPQGQVTASAIILSPAGLVIATLPSVTAQFNYGDSNQDICESVKLAVREAVVRAGLESSSLNVEIVTS